MKEVSGKAVVIAVAVVVVLAAAMVVAYKLQTADLPPAQMNFERSSPEAAILANATVHPLDVKQVPKATYNMDAYLDTAVQSGSAHLGERIPAETFRDFLVQQTGEPGPAIFVLWKDVVVRVEWTGL